MTKETAVRLAGIVAVLAGVAVAASKPPSWRVIDLTDEFGRVVDHGAASGWEPSRPPMEFPYQDVTGRIVVESCRASLRFSTAPNLRGGTFEHGQEYRNIAVLLDGSRRTSWSVRQPLGGKVLFVIGGGPVQDLRSAGTVAVSLPWHGGRGTFTWDLTGSGDAIRSACN